MLIVPDLAIIANWLKKMAVIFYHSQQNCMIELIYLHKIKGVSNAMITLIDDILTISIQTHVKQIALQSLLGEVSQINSSTFLAKAYLQLNDFESAKMIFSHSVPVSEGITFNQFSLLLSRFEEEALQVIAELSYCELLLNTSEHDDFLKTDMTTFTLN